MSGPGHAPGPELSDALERAARRLREADALVVTAGAGMGVDSGLPDFRGPEGFWRAYPAVARLGLRFEEMAQPRWFRSDPELAWAFYGHRLNLYRATPPHAGFERLRAWMQAKSQGGFVFTSNVDGHFQRAGFDAARIVECHGSVLHFQCVAPCGEAIWDAPAEPISIDDVAFRARPPLPRCPHCGGLARPNVLMFGDWLWVASRTGTQEERLDAWRHKVRAAGARIVVLEFGAGRAVPTVRRFSENLAAMTQGTLIRINPREPEVPPGGFAIPLGAVDALNRLAERL